MHLKYCIWRQFLLVSRDKAFLRSRATQSVVMGLLTGSLYFGLGSDEVSHVGRQPIVRTWIQRCNGLRSGMYHC